MFFSVLSRGVTGCVLGPTGPVGQTDLMLELSIFYTSLTKNIGWDHPVGSTN